MEEANKELKKKIESILFAVGKKIDIVEIAKLCRMSHNIPQVESILNELKEKYNKDESPLFLNNEGTEWKLTVRERYISVVQNIVKQSELSKTIMETLAIVAYKAPVLQSVIIKVRTNKAYDHLRELEKAGYLTREKKGRTKLIKLTPKFFEYFDIPPDHLKERFKNVHELEKAVEAKEGEVKEIKNEFMEKKVDAKKTEEERKKSTEEEKEKLEKVIKEKEEKIPEIDLVDESGRKTELNTYNSEIIEGTDFEEPKSNIEVISEKVGGLDVVDMGLPPREKKKLVEEAARLRREAEAEAKGKLGEAAVKEGEKAKEKEFAEKFDLVKGRKEGKEEKEEVEKPEPTEGGKEEEPEEKKEAKAKEGAEEEKEEGEKLESEIPNSRSEASRKPEEGAKPEEKPSERLSAKGIAAEAKEKAKKSPQATRKGKKLFEKGVPKGIQDKIDKRVEEIVFGKKKEEEEKKEENKGEKKGTPERY